MYPAYGGANQLWKWGPDGTLFSKMGPVAGIANGASNEQGTHCTGRYPTSGTQKWCYEDGTLKSPVSNLVMDIAEDDRGIAAIIHLWRATGNLNQKWTLVPEDDAVGMSNYFYIQSQLSVNKLVLTIDGFQHGGDLVMYPAYGGANQLWKWGPDDTLVSKMGLVADTQGACNEEGTPCIGWNPNNGANQKWLFENDEIKSTMNNLVMDIAEGDKGIAAFVHMWEATGNLNQKWTLVPEEQGDDMVSNGLECFR